MFTRIVKMEFRQEHVFVFLKNFNKMKEKIRAFPGCEYLELQQDRTNKCIFFTYSKWQREEDLEAYMKSDFFKEVWSNVKPLLSRKAEAWSVDTVHSLE